MDKHWIASALEYLTQSLEPVPHEINEIDWKGGLSPEKNRLTEHLIAFANHLTVSGMLMQRLSVCGKMMLLGSSTCWRI